MPLQEWVGALRGDIFVASVKASPKMAWMSLARPRMSVSAIWESRGWFVGPPGVLGEGGQQRLAHGLGQCDGLVRVNRHFGFPAVYSIRRYGVSEGRDPKGVLPLGRAGPFWKKWVVVACP